MATNPKDNLPDQGGDADNGDTDYDSLFPEAPDDYIEERNFLLQDIPYEVVYEAWFILSHLLVDEGSKIVHMGCKTGELTYAMAALSPKMKFIGVDKSKRNIIAAREKYKTHNLEFKQGDVTGDIFPAESLDVIINSFILHIIFSNARYNETIINDVLRKHFNMLKSDGIMFIRDYARPPPNRFVLIEMHDEDSESEKISDLSEADLLEWYSEHARPRQTPGCGGFFLEELPPRFPKTRLFRIPYKWAYEFIMRKDNRKNWEHDLPYEYTFFTVDDFRQELRRMGARIQYSAPHWDEKFIKENFDGHFRLYDNDGNPMGDPPTSFISVSRKLHERESLLIKERRIFHDEDPTLEIKALRNEKTGEIVDVVTRDLEIAEILPYRITEENRLNVFLHDGIARGIVNSVSRSGENIDGRQWSGHMVEPIAIDQKNIKSHKNIDAAKTRKIAREFIGLKPKKDCVMEEGAEYYPDPNYIDEKVYTYYLEVDEAKTPIAPKSKTLQNRQFHAKGVIRELSAQTVLDAIAVGLIPNARLELQILALFQHLNMKAENWSSKDISIIAGEISRTFNVKDFMKQSASTDMRFREVKGVAGQLRAISSVFVEEGQSQGGRIGLSSDHVDFIISDDKTVNTAVVIPLTKSMKGDVHAGFLLKHTPVPQRHTGNGLTVSAPQFNIPKEIDNLKQLKQFIAEKFGVTPDMVIKLGESYYSHIGITPEKIHPFAISAPPGFYKDPEISFIPFYQYMLLWKSISKEPHFMTTLARAYRFLPAHMKTQAKLDVKKLLEERFRQAQPDWSVPASFQPVTPHDKNQASEAFGSAENSGKEDKDAKSSPETSQNQEKEDKKEEKLQETDPLSDKSPKDYYKKKEKEKKKKKEKAKREKTSKKGKSQSEPQEASFDAQENEEKTQIDLLEDTPFNSRVEEEQPDEDIDEDIKEDVSEDLNKNPDEDFDEEENDEINLLEDFEREIEEMRELLEEDEDNEHEPRPEKW